MQARSASQPSPLPRGASAYSRFFLHGYDFVVHSLSNRLAWNCPTSVLLDFIRENLSNNHLEIGIGSGRLLRKAIAGKLFQRLVVADVNPACLDYAATILAPWQPESWTFNLLELRKPGAKLPLNDGQPRFDSLGLNYVLHCLPCSLAEKIEIVGQLVERWLGDHGILFGSMIFPDLPGNSFSRWLMRFYNRRGIFGNADDHSQAFQDGLQDRGLDCRFETRGCVVLFTARSRAVTTGRVAADLEDQARGSVDSAER